MAQDFLPNLKSVFLRTEVSKKTNNPYTYLDVTYLNDYQQRIFLTSEQKFIISSMAKTTTIPVANGSEEDFAGFLEN